MLYWIGVPTIMNEDMASRAILVLHETEATYLEFADLLGLECVQQLQLSAPQLSKSRSALTQFLRVGLLQFENEMEAFARPWLLVQDVRYVESSYELRSDKRCPYIQGQ